MWRGERHTFKPGVRMYMQDLRLPSEQQWEVDSRAIFIVGYKFMRRRPIVIVTTADSVIFQSISAVELLNNDKVLKYFSFRNFKLLFFHFHNSLEIRGKLRNEPWNPNPWGVYKGGR